MKYFIIIKLLLTFYAFSEPNLGKINFKNGLIYNLSRTILWDCKGQHQGKIINGKKRVIGSIKEEMVNFDD